MTLTPKLFGLGILAIALEATAGISVNRIDPPHWWTGMQDRTLQLEVHGNDIRDAEPRISYPGVRIDSVVRLDGSANWQYIYLTISPEAKPGTMSIEWREGAQRVVRKYELRPRSESKKAQGFTSADVMYLLMPDRFADANPDNNVIAGMRFPDKADRSDPNRRHGGDIKGIMQHLDYLDTLGMTAIWVNPVLENDMPHGSYHGYATTDYYRIDPRFGTNADYRALTDSLHGRSMKMVMDMIFNHCGSEHPWALDPPASDWFNFPKDTTITNYRLGTVTDPYSSDYDRKLTLDGWFVREMPDLNQRNPHLMKYLTQNSIWWIEEVGIDGIRMDTYAYIDADIMGRWVDAVMAEYPDFNIVGECWYGDPAGVAYWQSGSAQSAAKGIDTRLPTVMDFPLMIKSRDMKPFREETTSWTGLNTIYDHLALDFIYKDPLHVLRFLDNHDTERFIVTPVENLDGWKQAITLLLTMPGIPQIYYGTELLMSGTREGGDGNVRRDMPGGFPGDTINAFSAAGQTPQQNEAYDFMSKVARWRKGSEAVAKGSTKHFLPDNGLYVLQRAVDGEQVIVVMNGTDSPISVDMSRYGEIAEPGAPYTDMLTGAQRIFIPESGQAEFAPREILILQRKTDK